MLTDKQLKALKQKQLNTDPIKEINKISSKIWLLKNTIYTQALENKNIKHNTLIGFKLMSLMSDLEIVKVLLEQS